MEKNVKIFAKTVDKNALDQIQIISDSPAFEGQKIRIMPDCHAGKGCVIGFTSTYADKIIPNIVGVDLYCGMLVVDLGKQHVNLEKLDNVIHELIPSGMTVNEEIQNPVLTFDGKNIYDLLSDLRCTVKNIDWIEKSCHSLGGGNHFIEVNADAGGNQFLVIHTGSRNLGKQVAEFYQNLAIAERSHKTDYKTELNVLIADMKKAHRESEIQSEIKKFSKEFSERTPDIPNELCWVEGPSMDDYIHDVTVCHHFADENRMGIAHTILSAMGLKDFGHFTTLHNYIDTDNHVIRKGSISAASGERVLIPLNMRDGSIVGIGKGNTDWNDSAPHGAGRILSRREARENLSMNEFVHEMEGIYTTSVSKATIDESPMAYKPSDEILSLVKDTIDIVKVIKPVYNFKASE